MTAEEYAERIKEIKTTKPKHEIPIRLHLFQEVKGKQPIVLKKAYVKCAKAHAKWKETYENQKEAYEKHLPRIEKLHAKECGCKEWNGRELIFPKRSDKK